MSSFLQDNKTYIHIASEIIVLGGVSYYFNKKLSQSNVKINSLEQNVNELILIVKEQQMKIDELHNILTTRNNYQRNFVNPETNNQHRKVFVPTPEVIIKEKPLEESPKKREVNVKEVQLTPKQTLFQENPNLKSPSTTKVSVIEENDEDLDKDLEEELKELI